MEENIIENSIVITAGDLYYDSYCREYNSENECIHWTYVYPEQSIDKYFVGQAGSNSNTLVFILVLCILIRIIKGIFRWIFPSQGKK